MKIQIKALIFLLVLVALAAACSPPAPPAPTAAPASTQATSGSTAAPTSAPAATTAPTQAAASSKPGGALVWVLTPSPDTLDPHASVSSWAANQYYALYDTLVWQGPKQDFFPGLAKKWEMSPDGKTWTFYLRDDVTFHDDTAFTADSVKFNFDRIKSGSAARAIGKAAANDYLSTFESAKVIDKSTVAINFSAPNPTLLDAASTHFLSIVSPAAVEKWGNDYSKHPVGTGPFIFKETAPDHLTLVKNPKYNWAPSFFKHQGAAYLDQVTYRFVDEAGTRSAALESGEAQVMSRPSTADALRFGKDSKYAMVRGYANGLPMGYFPNVTKYPTNDIKVRMALEYATNPDLLNKTLFPDYYKPAFGPIGSTTWGYNPAVQSIYKYDPQKAKSLLDEAGWKAGADGIRVDKDGKKLTMLVQAVPNQDMIQAFQFQQALYKDVGIDINIVSADSAATNDICTAGKPEICPLYFGFTDPSGLETMFASRNAGTGFNWGQIKDPKLDQMLKDAKAQLDATKRAQMYGEVQTYIMQQAYWVPMSEMAQAHIRSKAIDGMDISYKDARFAYIYDASFVQK